MKLGLEKARPKGESGHFTAGPYVQNQVEMTARMQFYAIRSEGEQLRWAHPVRTGKQPDRMEGR